MKAVVRRGTDLVLDEVAEVHPGPGQVLVRTLACGICGSDLHARHHLDHLVNMARRGGAADVIDPSRDIVFGHEFCAELLDYGPGGGGQLKPGTQVVSMPIALSPTAIETVGYSNRYPGGFGERMVLTEAMLLAVPNGLAPTLAAMTEPMAVGAHAVAQAGATARSVALVIGCGPVGLSVIAALKARGLGPVIAADFSPMRRRLAEQMGADIVVDPQMASPHAHWDSLDVPATLAAFGAAQLAGRAMRDAVIFECVGVPGILQELIEQVPPSAHIVVVGACMEDDRIVPVLAINKQLRMSFVLGYSADEFAATLDAIAEGRIDVAPLLTATVPLSGVAAAFDALANPEHHAKIIVEPWRV